MDGGEGSFQSQWSAMPTEESHPSSPTIFPESRLAHEILDGLEGLEIGPAAHNPFGLRTRNVGLTADHDPVDYVFYRQVQLEKCGSFAVIDIPGDAANIPLADDSTDFVLHSHVWEHLPDVLAALDEWVRVVRSGGYIFAIVPKRDAAPPDRTRPLTSMNELLKHYRRKGEPPIKREGSSQGHYTVFSPKLLRDIATWFNSSNFWRQLGEIAYQETDDKVGNGHTIVWQVRKYSTGRGLISACLNRAISGLSS
jgi:SAM-dependent methyltransferase